MDGITFEHIIRFTKNIKDNKNYINMKNQLQYRTTNTLI